MERCVGLVQIDLYTLFVAFGGSSIGALVSSIVFQRKVDDHIKNSDTFKVTVDERIENHPTVKDHGKRTTKLEALASVNFEKLGEQVTNVEKEVIGMKGLLAHIHDWMKEGRSEK